MSDGFTNGQKLRVNESTSRIEQLVEILLEAVDDDDGEEAGEAVASIQAEVKKMRDILAERDLAETDDWDDE